MPYSPFREPHAGAPSRPGLLDRLVRDKRGMAASVAVIVVVVAASAVYLADAVAEREPSTALGYTLSLIHI